MNEEAIQEELEDYCRLWGINIDTTADNPAAALRILQAMYGVPLIERQAERRQALLKIGEAAKAAFPEENHPFHFAIGFKFGNLQENPNLFHFIANAKGMSPSELIDLYEGVQKGITRLKYAAGITGGAAAAGVLDVQGGLKKTARAGAAEMIRSGSVRKSIAEAVSTSRKPDALTEAVRGRIGGKIPVNVYTGLLTGALLLAIAEGEERLTDLRIVAEIKLQNGEMTEVEYRYMLELKPNEGVPPRYWE
ncbi:hypothetical protein [Paracoccus tegillarcae]|uniref:Uncharacterized protein n=1 Tax=Paracoccus tegillarcae TaxID=1529068 RepID=A0A2K9EI42_9RHOB|nr:hypothetical protein [Paracoccus tegillarcae]AUH34658.1 hypothetical protein CUV01_15855 [Paracoccus tegillarcae]